MTDSDTSSTQSPIKRSLSLNYLHHRNCCGMHPTTALDCTDTAGTRTRCPLARWVANKPSSTSPGSLHWSLSCYDDPFSGVLGRPDTDRSHRIDSRFRSGFPMEVSHQHQTLNGGGFVILCLLKTTKPFHLNANYIVQKMTIIIPSLGTCTFSCRGRNNDLSCVMTILLVSTSIHYFAVNGDNCVPPPPPVSVCKLVYKCTSRIQVLNK